MTKEEYNEAAALVVRLRKELEDATQDLSLHYDALKQSNAQCAEYLRKTEQMQAEHERLLRVCNDYEDSSADMHRELQSVIAERDKEYEAGALAQTKLAETIKDLAYSRLAVDTMRARDTRFTETIEKCGAAAGEDIGDFIERAVACRDQFHRELVEVRAALAATTEQRDSLRRTLDEWERADTKPHERVTDEDVADHVVPPVLPLCNVCHECGSFLRTAGSPTVWHCRNERCSRRNTAWIDDESPYHGQCRSVTPVRHE